MEEEEDWDAPAPEKASSEDNLNNSSEKIEEVSTPIKTTLKISDGYKYSYEAHASPANIDDWVDEPSYSSSNRMNGFGSSPRPFRGRDRGGKRGFDSSQRGSWKGNSSRGFGTPRGGGRDSFKSRPTKDWDTPKSTPNDAWNNLTNPAATPVADDWDAPANISLSRSPVSTAPSFLPPIQTSRNVEQENWDDDGGAATTTQPVIPSFTRPIRESTPQPLPRSSNYPPEEESWDDPQDSVQQSSHSFPPARNVEVPVQPTPLPMNAPVEESWDSPTYGAKSNPLPVFDLPRNNPPPVYDMPRNPIPVATNQINSAIMNIPHEESWDDDNSGVNTTVVPSAFPIFRPDNSSSNNSFNNSFQESAPSSYDTPFSRSFDGNNSFRGSSDNAQDYNSESRYGNRPMNDRYQNSPHTNKYARERNFESRGRFREPYDRFGGGRGGGRGGGNRGGWNDRRQDRGGRGRGRGGGGRDFRNDNRLYFNLQLMFNSTCFYFQSSCFKSC